MKREIEAADERRSSGGRGQGDARRELERKNKELEAFSYSVSHDLRAPLREYRRLQPHDPRRLFPTVDEKGQSHLRRVCAAAKRMGELNRRSARALAREPNRAGTRIGQPLRDRAVARWPSFSAESRSERRGS